MSAGYEGENYISVFWGDGDANFSRDLDYSEKTAVEKDFNGGFPVGMLEVIGGFTRGKQ